MTGWKRHLTRLLPMILVAALMVPAVHMPLVRLVRSPVCSTSAIRSELHTWLEGIKMKESDLTLLAEAISKVSKEDRFVGLKCAIATQSPLSYPRPDGLVFGFGIGLGDVEAGETPEYLGIIEILQTTDGRLYAMSASIGDFSWEVRKDSIPKMRGGAIPYDPSRTQI